MCRQSRRGTRTGCEGDRGPSRTSVRRRTCGTMYRAPPRLARRAAVPCFRTCPGACHALFMLPVSREVIICVVDADSACFLHVLMQTCLTYHPVVTASQTSCSLRSVAKRTSTVQDCSQPRDADAATYAFFDRSPLLAEMRRTSSCLMRRRSWRGSSSWSSRRWAALCCLRAC